jgi:hypothetical protein
LPFPHLAGPVLVTRPPGRLAHNSFLFFLQPLS